MNHVSSNCVANPAKQLHTLCLHCLQAVQLATFLFCFGCMVLYMVIVGDILAGSSSGGSGLLAELLQSTPLGQTSWLTDRSAVLMAVGLLVCGPLLSLRCDG